MRIKTKQSIKKALLIATTLIGLVLLIHGLIFVAGFTGSLNLVEGEHYNALLIPDPCRLDLTESATVQVSVFYPYELTAPSVFVELFIDNEKVSSGFALPTTPPSNVVQFSHVISASNYPIGTYQVYAVVNVVGKWSEILQPTSELIVVDASAPPQPTKVYIQAFGDADIVGANVKVTALESGTQVFSGPTNEYNHVIVNLADGVYRAEVTKEGFFSQEKTFTVPATTNVIFNMEKIVSPNPTSTPNEITLPGITLSDKTVSYLEIGFGIILTTCSIIAFKKYL